LRSLTAFFADYQRCLSKTRVNEILYAFTSMGRNFDANVWQKIRHCNRDCGRRIFRSIDMYRLVSTKVRDQIQLWGVLVFVFGVELGS
jgi:hypothetical protein